MLAGSLPFDAVDAMEWIYCHIARQPASPTSLVPGVPPTLSAIIAKLLAKAAEDRYQTAAGLEHDLKRCLAVWQALHWIDPFPLGELDIPSRLLIPEKLYGRERDIDSLLAAFDNVLENGTPELVLVSGFSGIGKSAVVNELHKVLVLPRALFASGKFDQYKHDIPYATLAQAFQNLIRQLLGQTEAELSKWRDNLLHALDPNGLLITDLIPELKLIIGEQPAVPELSPQEVKLRFQLVFRRFISVFARPEHPLALFLDDLQWLDAATLDLIENLLAQSDVQHLLLIGAYRDNEVSPAHPLMRRLEATRKSGANARHIMLGPLSTEDLTRLVTETFDCESNRAVQLAQLILEKTAGNPFFVIQFITALVDEGLIAFDYTDARWCWDLNQIKVKGYTDNVVDLMASKLNRLPVETQTVLQHLACLGNRAAITSLSTVCNSSEEKVHTDLWEARRAELVVRTDGAYKFVHDRVQEAAYSTIPEVTRADLHLKIGRLLAVLTPPEKQEEVIFEVVSQFERGINRVTSREERKKIAEINLMAGKRAMGSAAYASALTYFKAGSALLTVDDRQCQHELMFALELNRAECEFLTGQSSVAEDRLGTLSGLAVTAIEKAVVASLRIDVCTALDQPGRAVDVCLNYLRHVGIEWSPHPKEEEARREYERIWSVLGDRQIEDIIDLPLMEDAITLAVVDVLTKVVSSAWHTDLNLVVLMICKTISLSFEHGNCDASCTAYSLFGIFAGQRFGDYQAGFRFGRLGCDLVDQRGLQRFEARTYMTFSSFVMPWTRHIRDSDELLRRALQTANKVGDLNFVAYSGEHLTSHLLAAGATLDDIQREAENGLAFAQKARFESVIDRITAQLALIRTLRGLTPTFGSFDDGQFDELKIEQHLCGNPDLAMAACRYWIRKLQARFLAGDYVTAVNAASNAQSVLWTLLAHFETAEYHFYGALAHAASCESVPIGARRQHLMALTSHQRQLQIWAENCPANFEDRVALVSAEVARIEGRALEAMELYDKSIRSARANNFVHHEAIAYEVASSFYAGRGFEEFARAYLEKARYGYQRWGAEGKVRQLEERCPQLGREMHAPTLTSTIAAPFEHLDLATVAKVSNALSGEMKLERLIDTLLRLAIEHAGAERGVLLLSRGNELRREAEAIIGGNSVVVRRPDAATATLPDTIIHYVVRTRKIVILDDASTHPTYAADAYVRDCKTRSVLCLPLVNESKVTGVLYLENNLTPRVFTPDRISVLKLLALQAAISLQNAHLYSDLAQAEEARDRIRSELAHMSRVVSLGALTASIAHEINQPLASIVTNGETALRWLSRSDPNLDTVRNLTKRAVRDAQRAAEIIDRIRTMASRGTTNRTVVRLAEVIMESMAFLNHELQSRGISLSLDLAPDLAAVAGDRTQLQQVIVNLVMNAVQALTLEAADKRITIRTRQESTKTVCCLIEDSGPGIDAEHSLRLFESFFTTKETGMGLGLPIVQSIIEAHGGVIRADNKSSLGGARFIFGLPASSSLVDREVTQ